MRTLLAGAVLGLAALLVAKQVQVVDLRLEIADALEELARIERWVESPS